MSILEYLPEQKRKAEIQGTVASSDAAEEAGSDYEIFSSSKDRLYGIGAALNCRVNNRVKTIIDYGITTEIDHIFIGQNGTALSLHNTATSPDGKILDEYLATVLTIESSLIKRIDTYLSDVPMMESFFK